MISISRPAVIHWAGVVSQSEVIGRDQFGCVAAVPVLAVLVEGAQLAAEGVVEADGGRWW
jgi:hypothetical protein